MNNPVKSQFNSPAGGLYQAYWNGKTYQNDTQYVAVRALPNGKEMKVTVRSGVCTEYHMSYGRELAEAAAKAVGLMNE